MRVLVAGSSGFLGTRLVSELREHGHEVRRLVRRAPKAGDEYSWDPPAGTLDDGALDTVDAVVNLCGSPMLPVRWSHARKQAMKDSRVEPTEVLAAAVAERGVGVLVNASGVDFYGDTGETPVDESGRKGSGFLADLTAEWEQATTPARESGARVVLLRTGIVIGPGGGVLRFLAPLARFGLAARLGGGRQYWPWIGLPDHAAAIRFILENPPVAGPVNVCAPNPVSNAEFVKAMGRKFARPAPLAVPKPVVKAALGPDASAPVLHSHRTIPKALLDAGFTFTHQDLDDALTALV